MPASPSESLGLRLLAVVLLVLANAFFVAAEFALVAARRTRIEALVRRGDRKAKTVQSALQDLYRQLSAAQLGITVASILLGYVAEDTVAQLFRGAAAVARLPHPGGRGLGLRGGRDLVPARRVRRAGPESLGHHLPGADQPVDRGAAHSLLLDHPAVHRSAQPERQPGRGAPRDQGHHRGARPHPFARGDPDAD